MPAATRHDFTFSQVVEGFLRAHGHLSFLQVGGYDGVSFDPLRAHILNGDLTGVIVEPVPMHFEKLQALYAGSDRIGVENCAVDTAEGERTLWFFSRDAIAKGTIGDVFGGISSFLLPTLLEKGGTLGGIYTEENRAILLSLVESITVPCRTYDSVIARHNLDRIDLLQIDTEGYDYELLKAFDFTKYRPSIVQYECQHLSPEDRAASEAMLIGHGYVLNSNDYDTVAVRGIFLAAMPTAATPALIAAADTLLADGHGEQALAIYSHCLALAPQDLTIRMGVARAASLAGQHDEALRHMQLLKGRQIPGIGDSMPHLRKVLIAASEAFNEKLVAKDYVAMESIIEGLANIVPRQFLGMAFTLADSMQRQDKAVDYAKRLMAFEPGHARAHEVLAAAAERDDDTVAMLHHRAKAVVHADGTNGGAPRLLSQEAYLAASEILTRPYDPELAPLIDELRAAIAVLPPRPGGETVRLHDRFNRCSLASLDMSLLDEPLTQGPPPVPPLAFADCTGSLFDATQMPQQITALQPGLVFLAAADEVYLRRYGRMYCQSILDKCDVDCAVLVCMIGDAARLKDIAAEIGITDLRLFYLAHPFDPSYAVTYHTVDSIRTDCANAFYQSVRFLILEHLLHVLQRPIIVSDIDVVLQGSVTGLLGRHPEVQVVLNRNPETNAYGSQYTANLLLLRPGETSRQLTRFWRLFLERALERDTIEQFIDQSALTLARYYCSKHGLEGIDLFHKKDINNLMFNKTDMSEVVIKIARSYVFFAYYGSEGASALDLMNAVSLPA